MSGHGQAGFQTFTNVLQAPGIEGDFCSMNPRHAVLSSQYYGNAGLRAGTAGVRVGYFGWLDATGTYVNNFGAGAPAGVVHRCENALITAYLDGYSMIIPGGMMDGELFDAADFWVKNNGTIQAVPGMKAYANNVTGAITFAATGTPTLGGTSTASTISAQTSSFTGVIADNVLTASAVTGLIVPGEVIAGTGVATGTTIVAQLTGTANGAGTYTISIREQTVASEAMTGTYGLLTIGGTVAGSFGVGQTLTNGSTTTYGTITGLGTGVGAAGTYYTQTQTVGSGTIDTVTNTETKWFCRSFGLAGEIVKISSVAEN